MAKQAGMGDNIYVGGYDLSGDVGSLSRVAGGHSTYDKPGIQHYGMVRIGGTRDGGIDFASYFNPTAGAAHPVLSALPTTDTMVTYCRGASLGSPAACLMAKQVNYDATRSADGDLNFTVSAVGNKYGLEWGKQLTAGLRTDTEATNGTGVDFTAGASFGLQLYLQVTALTGTDVTFTVQQSSDNGSTDAFAAVTGGAFTAVTAVPAWQRLQTARDQAVERYLRVVTSTSAGFTSVTFNVVAVFNTMTVSF